MRILSLALALALVLSITFSPQNTLAQGGGMGGNGGRSIVCTSARSEILSAELLDLYEGRTVRKIQIDESLGNLDRNAILERVANQLALLDLVEGKQLIAMMTTALQDITALETNDHADTRLVQFLDDRAAKIDDSSEIFIPKNCSVEQFIIQKQPAFPEDRLFTIQKHIWLKMNPANQIASLLHEVLFYRAINQYQVSNSTGSRYLVSKIFSNQPLSRHSFIAMSAIGQVAIKPTSDEFARPSTYPWKLIPARFELVKKLFSDITPIQHDYFYVAKLGKCAFNGILGNAAAYDRPESVTSYSISKQVTTVDHRGRPKVETLFSERFSREEGWLKIAELLGSGKCD